MSSSSNAPRWSTLQTDAARARAAVEAAVNARGRLIDELDQRRDLAAQFVVELQQAQLQLERTIASADTSSTVASLPIRPFQGDLAWPVDGKVASRFGRSSSGRFGTSIVRNGIELATAQGTTASAVHEGTVAFAGPFAGFGTLVIVDHGNSAFTLYGHLIEAAVSAGTNVSRGTALGQGRPVAVRRSRPVFRAAHRRPPSRPATMAGEVEPLANAGLASHRRAERGR